jgi:hypothetical protein
MKDHPTIPSWECLLADGIGEDAAMRVLHRVACTPLAWADQCRVKKRAMARLKSEELPPAQKH